MNWLRWLLGSRRREHLYVVEMEFVKCFNVEEEFLPLHRSLHERYGKQGTFNIRPMTDEEIREYAR